MSRGRSGVGWNEHREHLCTSRDGERADQAALWVRIGRIWREGSGLFLFPPVFLQPGHRASRSHCERRDSGGAGLRRFRGYPNRRVLRQFANPLGSSPPTHVLLRNSPGIGLLVSVEPTAMAAGEVVLVSGG